MLLQLTLLLVIPSASPCDGPADAQYYFGYGSNLSSRFMAERLKDGDWVDDWRKSGILLGAPPKDLGCYQLPEYQFGYTLDGAAFDEAYSAGNVTPCPTCTTLGVLYEISDQHLRDLDTSEDVPMAYARMCLPIVPCDERAAGQGPVYAWVYVGQPENVTTDTNPDPEYVDLLLEGAQEHAFPDSYVCREITPR